MKPQAQTISIGVLTVTAMILFGYLIAMDSHPPAVMASGVTAGSGDYVMTVGSASDRDEELLYLIDSSAQRLNVYRFDSGRKQIEQVQQLDLETFRKPPDTKGKQP